MRALRFVGLIVMDFAGFLLGYVSSAWERAE